MLVLKIISWDEAMSRVDIQDGKFSLVDVIHKNIWERYKYIPSQISSKNLSQKRITLSIFGNFHSMLSSVLFDTSAYPAAVYGGPTIICH